MNTHLKSSYKIVLSGLSNDSCKMDFPEHKRDQKYFKEVFAQWTQNPKSEIYSGYRTEVLQNNSLFEIKSLSEKLRKDFDTMIVFGIGGSALGAMAVIRALEPLLVTANRKRVEFCDNLDPLYFDELWQSLNVSKTVFTFISKSGSTVETISQLSIVLERLKKQNLDFQKQIVVVTDPEKGALRKWSETHSIKTLPVPAAVGGRFSVFTPVGSLPISFCGIDVQEFIDGAKDHFLSTHLEAEKVFTLAERLHDCELGGVRAHSFWPYSTTMRYLSSWFVQLWGESLGKIDERNIPVGSIPIPGIGATDQHSFLQLLAEGRKNVVSGFLKISQWPQFGTHSHTIPRMDMEFKDLSYLTGQSMGSILNLELEATETSLMERQRPTYRIELETLSPKTLGALMALLMDLTCYSGAIMQLNPFNQPGVEGGKIILKKLLSTP